MMSLIDLDDDQRWVPTHVNVTVLRARGLRTKGKHGSRYLYTIIQVGKEKFTTGLVEKAEMPEWSEECCFELLPGVLEEGGRGGGGFPPGSGDLVLTVMHRVLIGLDVFLGQTIIPLDRLFQEGTCPRDEWFKLNSKAGRKEKERGQLQVTVQFTRNNMTASMFDLTMKDKPRSAFGKLKDRVTGRKRGDVESSSAIVPGRYAALSGSVAPPFEDGGGGGGAVTAEARDVAEEKRSSKVKDFFKGRLRKSSDTRSCSSLASDSSLSSVAGDNPPAPPPSLDLLSDPPSSPIYTSKVRVDTHYGETDLAKKVLTSQHTTKVLTHKRAFSDEASRIATSPFPRSNPAMESLKGQTMTQSKSSLCINGSHVYDSEPPAAAAARPSGALPSKLVLLEKCSPLSRSLQNLTKRGDDKGSFAEGRRWSFDKTRKEEREEEKEARAPGSAAQQQQQQGPASATTSTSSAASSPEKGRKLRKTLFSGGRSESLPSKSDLNQPAPASEGRLRGWFGSGDSQNKPRPEVTPKVESPSDTPPPPPSPRSPSSAPISPSNPFLPHMQRNPFFQELIAEESQRSPPLAPPGSSPFHYTTLPCAPGPGPAHRAANMAAMRRERPRAVARQVSLPALLLPKAPHGGHVGAASRSMSESTGEWDDSFEALATSRLNLPRDGLPQKRPRISASCRPANGRAQEPRASDEQPPPLPPRRFLRTPVNEISSDGWLHRGQELAVHKEAYLLSQTGVASLQRCGRESESKRSESSDSGGAGVAKSRQNSAPASTSEDKLRKFKYEPLEDDAPCWGGTLFEQDLYGRMCRGNYAKQNVSNQRLSLNSQGNNALKKPLDGELKDGLNFPSVTPAHLTLDDPSAPVEGAREPNPGEKACINNNNVPLRLGDLNMNNADFGFIDSDGSSQSELADTLKGIVSLPASSPQPTEDSFTASIYQEEDDAPEEMFTLKDTYIPEMNSSFEIPVSTKRCQVSPGGQEETDNATAHRLQAQTLTSSGPEPGDAKSQASNDLKRHFDDNGNLQAQRAQEVLSGVVSARFRPKGSPKGGESLIQRGDQEFQQLLTLVKNISKSNGPLPYQLGNSFPVIDTGTTTTTKSTKVNKISHLTKYCVTGIPAAASFEDLHAKVAPKSPSRSKIERSLQEPRPLPPSDSQPELLTSPVSCPPSIHHSSTGPGAAATAALTVAPFTSTFTTTVAARHYSLLPEETQPANYLPRQESRPHPVKPLTSSQSEKKDGRSVLEKLKSTINPGRGSSSSAQQVAAEDEKSQEAAAAAAAASSAQYQHLTNMELISLLLQQEMDMQKQQAASDQQGAQLEKCEGELRKVKAQVRDLEDYIDNLLLRIMEQTPTLLQVRCRHK